MKRFVILALLGSMLSVALATAQITNNYAGYDSQPRGVGGIISAQGQRSVSNSQAAINLTDARSSQIQNQVDSVNAYWEKKGIYNEHQQQVLQAQDAERQKQIARQGLKPLTPDQFNRTTGQITWPGVLRASSFSQYQDRIDATFKARATGGILTGDDYLATTKALSDWRAAILKDKSEYPSGILDQMLRFLLEVKHDLDDNLG